jgi:hypothetical protein
MSFPPLKEETSPSAHIRLMVMLFKLREAYPRVGRSVSSIEHSGRGTSIPILRRVISVAERNISTIES